MTDAQQPSAIFQPDTASADFTYWAKMASWNVWEGAALLVGINANLARDKSKMRAKVNRDAVAKYDGILELAERAQAHGVLGFPTLSPQQWLEWARKRDIPVPPKLAAEVARLHAQDEAVGVEDRLARIGELEVKVEELSALLCAARSAATQSLPVRERDSMLKLIIGMAIAGYRYDPKAKRNDSVRDIAVDLERLGISLSDDTVRKYLSEGADLVPPDENEKR